MGGGNFGVEAASEFYFGKSVKDVNLAEAAMLAGLFKAPARYAPHVNLPAARARANEVLTNMVQAGFMTEGQVIGARRHPADVDRARRRRRLARLFPRLGLRRGQATSAIRRRPRADGAHHHRHAACSRPPRKRSRSTLRQYGKSYRVQAGGAWWSSSTDGAVRAMVGGRDYGESQFNRATDALRQPGSSFKPFVYATAMMNGFTPKSIVRDAPICIGNWCPQNYAGGYRGTGHADHRRWSSRSTSIPVRLAQAIGRDKIVETAKKMGITSELRITRSLPLGASEVTVSTWPAPMPSSPMAATRRRPTPSPRSSTARATSSTTAATTRQAAASACSTEKVVAEMNGMLVRCRNGAPAGAPSSTASGPPARPAPPRPIATPGSSASPATTSPPSGSATTTTRRRGG